MLLLCHPTCTTCQRARRWLDDHGIAYEARDIRLQNPTVEELRGWQSRSGLALRRFFNTSGQKYRELGVKDRLPAMSEAEQLELLASDGMLVRRPVLVTDTAVLVGFREVEWAQGLLA